LPHRSVSVKGCVTADLLKALLFNIILEIIIRLMLAILCNLLLPKKDGIDICVRPYPCSRFVLANVQKEVSKPLINEYFPTNTKRWF